MCGTGRSPDLDSSARSDLPPMILEWLAADCLRLRIVPYRGEDRARLALASLFTRSRGHRYPHM